MKYQYVYTFSMTKLCIILENSLFTRKMLVNFLTFLNLRVLQLPFALQLSSSFFSQWTNIKKLTSFLQKYLTNPKGRTFIFHRPIGATGSLGWCRLAASPATTTACLLCRSRRYSTVKRQTKSVRIVAFPSSMTTSSTHDCTFGKTLGRESMTSTYKQTQNLFQEQVSPYVFKKLFYSQEKWMRERLIFSLLAKEPNWLWY